MCDICIKVAGAANVSVFLYFCPHSILTYLGP